MPAEGMALNDAKANAQLIAWALGKQKLDLYTPGPQDFAQGPQTFKELVKIAQLPLLSSNLVDVKKAKPAYQNFMRLRRGDLPLLIIALQDPGHWPKDTGLRVSDPILSAQKILAQQARPGDLVILVAVTNMDTALKWAQQLPELSAVLVAQRRMMSFFPREFIRPQDKGHVDGSSLPLMAAGHGGGQLIQMDIYYHAGDSLLRGGAVFEDAREQIDKAKKVLAIKPKDLAALEKTRQAQKILDQQKGLSHYRYRYVEMSADRAEGPMIKDEIRRRQKRNKPDASTGRSKTQYK